MTRKKSDPTVEVLSNEYMIALLRWNHFWCDTNGHIHQPFSSYLGMHAKPLYSQNPTIYMLRQSAARKIRMLNQAHWKTLLIAYKMKYNIFKKD